MRKFFAIQVALIVLFSCLLSYVVSTTDVYDRVKTGIVSVICLSCIKMKPAFEIKFFFRTANLENYPSFILENLSNGIIFLHFRVDSCKSCDHLDEVISDIFKCNLKEVHYFVTTSKLYGVNVTLFHINLDHVSKDKKSLYNLFNVMGSKGGVPMISIVTLGRKNGSVAPCYATLYGYQKKDRILDFIRECSKLYLENFEDFKPSLQNHKPKGDH